ncbi:MAG: lipoyl domain-containing protein [Anaerolineae bacterium]|nr:lipoyl domain-containing protein [Anaerolineae bacterium]
MRYEIIVPRTADGSLAVVILSWLKRVGDEVRQGEDVAEAKTEKITLYITAPATGRLVEIRVPAGQQARVGEVIGFIEGD